MRPGKRERKALAACKAMHLERVERARAVTDTPIHTSGSLLVSRRGTIMRGRPNAFIEDHPGPKREYNFRWSEK